MRKIILFAGAAALTLASGAGAQQTYPTAAGGVRVQGTVPLQCNASGVACAPVSATNPQTTSSAGDVANGATDSGNPVKVGAVYNITLPTYTGGQRTTAQALQTGAIAVAPAFSNTPSDAVANNAISAMVADAGNGGNRGMSLGPVQTAGFLFNGTSWDRQRGDTNGTYSVPSPSAAAATGLTPSTTSAVASAQVIKASAGNLYGFNVVTGASAGYVLVFNATSAPVDGAVTPVKCVPVAANTGYMTSFTIPIAFSTGITLVFSTTGCFNKTASATAFLSGDAK